MLEQARTELPNECCGWLAGTVTVAGDAPVGRVAARYPLVNAAASPTEFDAEARALTSANRDTRQRGLDVLAVYHSHPTTAPVPSRTDHERWGWGSKVVCLIVSLMSSPPLVRAWWLSDADHHEAVLEIEE
jgi:proteasome lid subunit RPN8/RPN11